MPSPTSAAPCAQRRLRCGLRPSVCCEGASPSDTTACTPPQEACVCIGSCKLLPRSLSVLAAVPLSVSDLPRPLAATQSTVLCAFLLMPGGQHPPHIATRKLFWCPALSAACTLPHCGLLQLFKCLHVHITFSTPILKHVPH